MRRALLDTPGRYQVKLLSPAGAASPAFLIGDGGQLYGQLVDNPVRYFTSERDGPDPKYDGNDNLLGSPHRAGGPVEPAGDYTANSLLAFALGAAGLD